MAKVRKDNKGRNLRPEKHNGQMAAICMSTN